MDFLIRIAHKDLVPIRIFHKESLWDTTVFNPIQLLKIHDDCVSDDDDDDVGDDADADDIAG